MAKRKKPTPKRETWSPFSRSPKGRTDPADVGSRYRRGPGGALINEKPHGPEHGRP